MRGQRPRPLDECATWTYWYFIFAVRTSDEGSLGEEDSNPRSWDQNPVSYQLDDPPSPHGRSKVAQHQRVARALAVRRARTGDGRYDEVFINSARASPRALSARGVS